MHEPTQRKKKSAPASAGIERRRTREKRSGQRQLKKERSKPAAGVRVEKEEKGTNPVHDLGETWQTLRRSSTKNSV